MNRTYRIAKRLAYLSDLLLRDVITSTEYYLLTMETVGALTDDARQALARLRNR